MDDEKELELAGLRQLAFRLLSPFGYDGSPEQQPDLLVGRIPPDFPIELPMPVDARIVGSVIGERRTDIFFDTKMPAPELDKLYSDWMAELGWMNLHNRDQTGALQASGFVSFPRTRNASLRPLRGPNDSFRETYYKDEAGPTLTIYANSPRDEVVAVQVTYQTYEHPERSPVWHRAHASFAALPSLYPPEGATQKMGGGGGGNGGAWRQMILTADRDIASVAEHYNNQLAEAGWERVDSGVRSGVDDSRTAASYWRFIDDSGRRWRGVLAALCHPDSPHDYFLIIETRWTAGPTLDPSGGTFTVYGPLEPRS